MVGCYRHGMSASDIVEEIQRLPREDRLAVMGKVLLGASNEDVQAMLRKRRVAAFNELCALMDRSEHLGKHMTEEEIIELALSE